MSTPRIPEKQIIIVDDEPEILMAVDTTLRMSGMNHVKTIQDSRTVMDELKKHLYHSSSLI